jgi:hypothetical protein
LLCFALLRAFWWSTGSIDHAMSFWCWQRFDGVCMSALATLLLATGFTVYRASVLDLPKHCSMFTVIDVSDERYFTTWRWKTDGGRACDVLHSSPQQSSILYTSNHKPQSNAVFKSSSQLTNLK